VANNDNHRAILHGYSLGALIVHRFLTEETTAEWRSRYIERISLLGPAFSGASLAPIGSLFGRPSGRMWLWVPNSFTGAVKTWPAVHTFLPNAVLFNETVVLETEGEMITGSGLLDFLLERAGLNQNERDILRTSSGFSRTLPNDPGVPSCVIFNSALETAIGKNLRTGQGVMSGGDTEVNAAGAQWVCKSWKDAVCVDLEDKAATHFELRRLPRVLKLLTSWIVDDHLVSKHSGFGDL
jgi:hypothetical protein